MEFHLHAMQEAYENSPSAFCVIKVLAGNAENPQDFTFEYANPALAKLTGLSPDALPGSFCNLFANAGCKWLALCGEVAKNGGSQTITAYSPMLDKDLQMQCYQIACGYCGCLILDVTKATAPEASPQAEKADSFQAMQKIYNTIPVAVFQCRFCDNWPIQYANDGFYKFFGYTKDEFAERFDNHAAAVIHPDDLAQVCQSTTMQLSTGVRIRNQMRAVKKDGSIRWIDLRSEFARDESGEESLTCAFVDITEQKEAEEALRVSEEKFKLATETYDIALSISNHYIWEYDILGKRRIQQSKVGNAIAFEPVMENAPESLIAKGLIHPDSIDAYRKLHAAVCRGEKSATADICYLTADQKKTWKRCTYTTIFANGKPVNAIGSATNIDAVKEMEQKFEQEYAFLESLQSANLLTKVRANVTKGFLESYQATGKASVLWDGATYQQGIDKLSATALTEEEAAQIRYLTNRDRVLAAFHEGDTQYGMDYRRKLNDGSVVWTKLLVKTYQNPENGDVMSFMYTYDINDEKIKEGILETVSALEYDFILYIDLLANSMKTYVGREFNAMVPAAFTGNYVEEMEKLCYAEILPEDVELAIHNMMPETMKAHLKEQRVFSAVYTGRNNGGQLVRKRIQYAYLNEEAQQIVMTRTDVTDMLAAQKKQHDLLEAALAAAEQANSAKSDFLSRMSHEIRTPMNAIIGMSAIAAQSIGDDAQVADCIGKIGISSRFLLSLINDILDMSRIESGKILLKPEKIPFEEFLNGINSICYTQAMAKDIDYENIVHPNVEDYYIGDAMKLQQVMINILSNAIKFTPERGKVAFSVREIKKSASRATLRFVINDTGCGISEEFIPHLFDPFSQEHSGTTTVYGGTGLGLAISKSLVEMMHGQIGVRSIVGVGTEFTVDVQLGITEECKKRYLSKSHYHFEQLKALVIDDDITICEHTVITLKEIGIASEWVDSGRKAVDQIRKMWASKQYYDLVLVDWKMPEMDGIETARQIRKIVGPDVTIIIMTAYDWTSIEHEAKLAGVNLLMSKPMFKSSLISAFEKVLGKQVAEATVVTDSFRFEGKRILLAEDHPLNVEVARKLLERKGFTVEHAENGLRALEMVTTSPEGYYDAILMDIRMPQMDGLQAANAIRHLTKEDAKTVPIIAMTANAFDEDVQKSKSVGMNAHLAKPIDPQQLYQTLFDFIYGEAPLQKSDC